MFSKTTIRLNQALYDRVRLAAQLAGYSSPEEFVEHAVEKELARAEGPGAAAADDELVRQLRGLGYIK